MGRRFVAERKRDPFYRSAQREGLRSRAAYKLASLAERLPIFARGDAVLDLGAAPGGWTLIARELVGPGGTVVAVDPRAIEPIPGVEIVRRRVGDRGLEAALGADLFDVVLSDMSPQISGAYATDHARSVDLARAAFDVARTHLRRGGSFVAKVFAGDLLAPLEAELRRSFERWQRTKPPASRDRSSEVYLVGLGFHERKAPDGAG